MACLRGVRLPYGKVEALGGINLDIPAGCMVGIMGPDGIGKSTVLSLIAGARAIQKGQVEVLGGSMAKSGQKFMENPEENLAKAKEYYEEEVEG